MAVPILVSLPPITTPMLDRSTGLMTDAWYRWFEAMQRRTGGDQDQVSANTIEIIAKADKTIAIDVGNGLQGGGTLDGDITIAADQDTGWTAATGAGDKTAYTQYAGQTVSVGYVQAEAQETDDAAKAASSRLVALEGALRANGAIDG